VDKSVGSLAIIALILTALGIMLCIVKPADALRRVAAILGIVIVLIFIHGVLVSAWSCMPLWEKIGFVAIGVAVWQWRRPQQQQRKR
jgi:predicted membrane protein